MIVFSYLNVISELRPSFDGQSWPHTNAIFSALNAENESKVNSLLSSNPSAQVLNQIHSEIVTLENILCLREMKWLNDEVINFYMALLEDWSKHTDNRRTFIFTTFFMDKLLKNVEEVRMWRSRRRAYAVDVWSVEQLLIPIHVGLSHWALLVVHPQVHTMMYLDSLHFDGNVYLDAVTRFFKMRAATEQQRGTQWQLVTDIKPPRQPNPYDCGVYTIINACLLTKGQAIHESSYSYKEAKVFRKKIAYSICKGSIDYL
jgi:Ulp1 family protease